MKPASFEYHAPESVTEVVELLRDLEDAKPLAGGQSLVPMLALRLTRFEHLIDLRRVPELRGVDLGDGSVRVAAMTTQSEIEHDAALAAAVPLLARATPFIGHFQIRNRGTLGGAIAHADPAAESPAVAVTLSAEIEIVGPGGVRRVPARDFFVSTWTTLLDEDEIVAAVHFPTRGDRAGYAVDEVARRHGDFALAGVLCAIELTGDHIGRAGIGLLGLANAATAAIAAEVALVGMAVADVDAEEIAQLAVRELDPPGDIHASGEFRKHLAKGLVVRTLTQALKEAVDA